MHAREELSPADSRVARERLGDARLAEVATLTPDQCRAARVAALLPMGELIERPAERSGLEG